MRPLNDKERQDFEDAKKATREYPAFPCRVNIIFHGLLAFRDLDTNYYEVLIPKTSQENCHEAKYGNPCAGGLKKFDVPRKGGPGPAYFSFEGIQPEPLHRRSFPSATNILVMKNNLITPQYDHIAVIIKVPKPFIVRHYRGGETHLHSLAKDASAAVLQRNPDVLHEVTVFSYISFFEPRLVGQGGVNYPIPQPNPKLPVLNIGIYNQPAADCKDTDSADFSAMFKVNPNVDFAVDLSTQLRIDDSPPLFTSPQVGISFCEMLALKELADIRYQILCWFLGCCMGTPSPLNIELATTMREIIDIGLFGAIPGGCGAAFVCDDAS